MGEIVKTPQLICMNMTNDRNIKWEIISQYM